VSVADVSTFSADMQELVASAVQTCLPEAIQATFDHFKEREAAGDGAVVAKDSGQFASFAVDALCHLAMVRIQHEASIRTKAIFAAFVVGDAPSKPVWTTTATITQQFVLREAERQVLPMAQAAIRKEMSK
jgi:hypothetical protein